MQKQQTASEKIRKRKLSTDVTHKEPKANKTAKSVPTSPLKSASPIKKIKKQNPTKTLDTKVSPKSKTLKKKKRPKKTTTVLQKEIKKESVDTVHTLLKNNDLVQKCRSVPMSNNQKGRIRQALRSQLQGSDNKISINLIKGKIQSILQSANDLKDSDLRKIRILYNMAQSVSKPTETISKQTQSISKPTQSVSKTIEKKEIKIIKEETSKHEKDDGDNIKKEKGNKSPKKKGPKRYVVFVGNLPLNITKEKVKQHFSDIVNNIKDIRLPQRLVKDEKKSAYAFMEVSDKTTYEAALSKHHSMLDNKRINVSFTLQEKSKLTKSEAKGKAAKLVALQKAGKLAGSTALSKKRSHRRNIMKRAKAKEAASENA